MYKKNVVLIKAYYGNHYVNDMIKALNKLDLEKKLLYVNEYGDLAYKQTNKMGVVVYANEDDVAYEVSRIKSELVKGDYEMVIIDGDFQNFTPQITDEFNDIVFLFVIQDLEEYNDENQYLIVDLDDIKNTSLLKRKSRANFYKARLEEADFIKKFNLFG